MRIYFHLSMRLKFLIFEWSLSRSRVNFFISFLNWNRTHTHTHHTRQIRAEGKTSTQCENLIWNKSNCFHLRPTPVALTCELFAVVSRISCTSELLSSLHTHFSPAQVKNSHEQQRENFSSTPFFTLLALIQFFIELLISKTKRKFVQLHKVYGFLLATVE